MSQGWSYPVILSDVKTAISVPDTTFDRVTRRARELGMSRSELFTKAAEHYLEVLDHQSLSRRIDEALQVTGGDDSAHLAVEAGRRTLGRDDW